MAFELAVDDVDLSRVGGEEKVFPGNYHMLVDDVQEEGGDKGEMIVFYQILRGSTLGMEGRLFKVYFTKDFKDMALRKLTAFALAARLVTKEELMKCKDERKAPMIEWTQAVGRSVCMELEDNEYEKNGRTTHRTQLAWDNIWNPTDKRAAHIPLHAGQLQKEGLKLDANRPLDGIMAAQPDKTKPGSRGAAKADAKKLPDPQVSADDALAGVI